jgi:hypothetical protein
VAAPGELLIRVRASGVNRPDVLQRMGNYPVPPVLRIFLALEVAGVIEQAMTPLWLRRASNLVTAFVPWWRAEVMPSCV